MLRPWQCRAFTAARRRGNTPGWCGMIYDRARHEYRGKFAETRFKWDSLAEYAQIFRTVCVGAACYTFLSQLSLEGMVNQTLEEFLFGLKESGCRTLHSTLGNGSNRLKLVA